jgi:hypothetical protein
MGPEGTVHRDPATSALVRERTAVTMVEHLLEEPHQFRAWLRDYPFEDIGMKGVDYLHPLALFVRERLFLQVGKAYSAAGQLAIGVRLGVDPQHVEFHTLRIMPVDPLPPWCFLFLSTLNLKTGKMEPKAHFKRRVLLETLDLAVMATEPDPY